VAFAIADVRDALPDNRSGDPDRQSGDIRIAGGGSSAPGRRQLLPDVLGARPHALDVPSVSARGAARTGAVEAGLIEESALRAVVRPRLTPVAEPRSAQAGYYAERRERFREAFRMLRPR
jgi:sugar (pentulose or hexulose) kinase